MLLCFLTLSFLNGWVSGDRSLCAIGFEATGTGRMVATLLDYEELCFSFHLGPGPRM